MTLRVFSLMKLWLLLLASQNVVAQQVIRLENASFEDYPQHSHTPEGWYDCGFVDESPPDVQPNAQFQVSKAAKAGKTYLGMVVRDNNTWEAVGQRLKVPLQKGVRYQFSLQLAKSEYYLAKRKTTSKDVNYVTPVIVRIWGGNTYCGRDENLADSEPIETKAWKMHTFQLKPKADYRYIMIEAFYKMPTLFPYNGNVLIDDASDFVPMHYDSISKKLVLNLPNAQSDVPCGDGADSTRRNPVLEAPNAYLYKFNSAINYITYMPTLKEEVELKAEKSVLLQRLDYDKLAKSFQYWEGESPQTHPCQRSVPQNAVVFYDGQNRIVNYLEWCLGCGYAQCLNNQTILIDNQVFTLKPNPTRKELARLFSCLYNQLK